MDSGFEEGTLWNHKVMPRTTVVNVIDKVVPNLLKCIINNKLNRREADFKVGI